MKLLLPLLFIVVFYSCQTSSTSEKSLKLQDTISLQKTTQDSSRQLSMIEMDKKIKIPRYWKSTTNQNHLLGFGVETGPTIYIVHVQKDITREHRLKSINDYKDSLSITTQNYNSDSINIWTFIPKSDSIGIWTLFKPQLKSYRTLGLFHATRPL